MLFDAGRFYLKGGNIMRHMKKEINLDGENISYVLRKSLRARRMRLAVYRDGSVVLTTPINLGENAAEKFIREKSRWLISKIYFFSQLPPNPIARHGKRDYLKYKEQALAFVTQKTEQLNTFYGYRYAKIGVRNQKTCWGSCSRKGNLNFNYKILFLPEKLQNYVIAHELCHLHEFNHSRRFWDLVDRTVPDHRELRAELRKTGLSFR